MLSKYGVARHIYIPLQRVGSNNFALSADWTPAAGDVKISKDGGAAANVTNLPTAIAMGNGAMWDFSLTATEMQAAQVDVVISDAATKVVEDQQFSIETYGHASAQHAFDLGTASTAQTGDSYALANGASGFVAIKTQAAAIEVDTQDLQSRTPAALVSGKMNSTLDSTERSTLANVIEAEIIDDTDSEKVLEAITNKIASVNPDLGGLTVAAIASAASAAVTTAHGVGSYVQNTEPLSAAGTRSALGLAAANLDTQLGGLPTNAELTTALGTADDAILAQVALVKTKTDLIPAAPAAVGDVPTAAQNAAAYLDLADGVEVGLTPRQAMRLMTAALFGKLSGAATTTILIRNGVADTKVRITATVDADGNRSVIVTDAT